MKNATNERNDYKFLFNLLINGYFFRSFKIL